MSGTKAGGQKAYRTNTARDPYFYQNIGRRGGQNSKPTNGFGQDHDRAVSAGRKGGTKSRRGPINKCDICGASPMEANCNNANCDV